MAKVVYNACYGGFGLSPKATLRLYELGCTSIATPVDKYWPAESRKREKSDLLGFDNNLKKWREYLANPPEGRSLFLTVFSPDEKFVLSASSLERTDPLLIQVVEELGDAANGDCAKLRIEELPEGTQYRIDEYDGFESVATRDSYEWRTA